MNLSLNIHTGLTQTLTPQQVQFLQLLQLTGVQLEQLIQQKLEENPMLDEGLEELEELADELSPEERRELESLSDEAVFIREDDMPELLSLDNYNPDNQANDASASDSWTDFIEDEGNPASYNRDDEYDEFYGTQARSSFIEDLVEQLSLLSLPPIERLIGMEILWNIDTTGYLNEPLVSILDTVRERSLELNKQRLEQAVLADFDEEEEEFDEDEEIIYYGPAKQGNVFRTIERRYSTRQSEMLREEDLLDRTVQENFSRAFNVEILPDPTLEMAEAVLKKIQHLDPPGIGARDLRECLIAQLEALPKRNAAQKLAVLVLTKTYHAFTMKHFEVIKKELGVTDDYLREALAEIRKLNPKPGGGSSTDSLGAIVPDFFVEYDEKKDDFIVTANDSRIPELRLNKNYERMRKEARKRKFNTDTKQWLKAKHDQAKFLMQALKQRRQTLVRVMTAIVFHQKEFFKHGEDYLRPLIYKDIATDTSLDISTVCRVVNGKYVQTNFGIFELKYFFSESMENTDGEEISTRVIKSKLREIINNEHKKKPFSDDRLAAELEKAGYQVARRTIAKYREQMQIPVARLRKEL